jgi:hypothetical protein
MRYWAWHFAMLAAIATLVIGVPRWLSRQHSDPPKEKYEVVFERIGIGMSEDEVAALLAKDVHHQWTISACEPPPTRVVEWLYHVDGSDVFIRIQFVDDRVVHKALKVEIYPSLW